MKLEIILNNRQLSTSWILLGAALGLLAILLLSNLAGRRGFRTALGLENSRTVNALNDLRKEARRLQAGLRQTRRAQSVDALFEHGRAALHTAIGAVIGLIGGFATPWVLRDPMFHWHLLWPNGLYVALGTLGVALIIPFVAYGHIVYPIMTFWFDRTPRGKERKRLIERTLNAEDRLAGAIASRQGGETLPSA